MKNPSDESSEKKEFIVPKETPKNYYPRKTLSAREFRFYKFLMEQMKNGGHEPLHALAERAGYSPATAHAPGIIKERIARVLTNNEMLQEKLEMQGLGLDSVVEDIGALRQATTVNKQGIVIPDNSTRLKTVQLRVEVMNALPPKKVQVEQKTMTMTISPQVLESIRKIKGEDELRKLLEE